MDSLASEACGSATVEESMLLCKFVDTAEYSTNAAFEVAGSLEN